VGLPKTVDNDVIPIRQSLGAWTAAEQGAIFAENIVSEHTSNPRMLIVHEVMGRNCGWLTAATAAEYRKRLVKREFAGFGNDIRGWDVHAVYVPELEVDLTAEAKRLKAVMAEMDCVNIFLSEGAGVDSIVAEMIAKGEEPKRDAFGHVKLDTINPGACAKQFAALIGAEKTKIQKSGISPVHGREPGGLALIKQCTELGERCDARGTGVVGRARVPATSCGSMSSRGSKAERPRHRPGLVHRAARLHDQPKDKPTSNTERHLLARDPALEE
jgi:pyrophosphate--fructose-6-phosphate 1-phosphotransferase